MLGKLHILLGSPFSFCEFLMIPSGKLTACYGKSPSLMGKPIINVIHVPFSIVILNYQRVHYISYLHVFEDSIPYFTHVYFNGSANIFADQLPMFGECREALVQKAVRALKQVGAS